MMMMMMMMMMMICHRYIIDKSVRLGPARSSAQPGSVHGPARSTVRSGVFFARSGRSGQAASWDSPVRSVRSATKSGPVRSGLLSLFIGV